MGIVVVSTLATLGLARAAPVPSCISSGGADRTAGPVFATLLSLAGSAAFVATIAVAVLLPVVAYDALSYRLPAIAGWLDAGRIAWMPTDDPVRNGYPLGQEAVSAVLARALDSMRFVAATSALYVASGAVAIALVARSVGVRRPLARAAACLFLLVPMVVLNAPSGYVDAAFAGATVAFLGTAALLVRAPDPWLALSTGLAAAHVLALKGNGIGFVGLTAIVVVGSSLLGRLPRRYLAITGAASAPGAFWALRNLVHTGNPLFPVEIRLFGHTMLPGIGTVAEVLDEAHNTPAAFSHFGTFGRIVRTWFETHGPATYFDDRFAGLGLAWVLFALPAIASFVWNRANGRRPGTTAVLLVVALTGACFALTPMRWWARYTIWLWGAGALAIAVEGEWLARGKRPEVFTFAMAALALVSVTEGGHAVLHANGALSALSRGGALGDGPPEQARNAASWVDPAFWKLGFAKAAEVCRGAWKPGTDNANLDGVFAQLSPRPRVRLVPDDDGSWDRVHQKWLETQCGSLLLFRGSPVLAAAALDRSVEIEPAVAFDPLYVVRPRRTATRDDREREP